MRSLSIRMPFAVVLTISAVSSSGCKSHAVDRAAPASASASAAAALVRSAAPSAVAPVEATPANTVRMPEGPVLAIQAGQGVGPIRIGATVATIERLMEAPCEVKAPDVCRYIVRAVEFHLDPKGFTDRIVIHRKDRAAGLDANGKPQTYGFFNGGIPPGVAFGMIPKAVIEMLGTPKSSERVTTPNEFHTIVRDTYPGMTLEYDEYANGKAILGGVILTKVK